MHYNPTVIPDRPGCFSLIIISYSGLPFLLYCRAGSELGPGFPRGNSRKPQRRLACGRSVCAGRTQAARGHLDKQASSHPAAFIFDVSTNRPNRRATVTALSTLYSRLSPLLHDFIGAPVSSQSRCRGRKHGTDRTPVAQGKARRSTAFLLHLSFLLSTFPYSLTMNSDNDL